MKSTFYIFVLFLLGGNLLAQNGIVQASEQLSMCDGGRSGNGQDEIFTIVEQMPEFPGGKDSSNAFLNRNLKYPVVALESNLSGKCFLRFIVLETGEICSVVVLKGVPGCPDCDLEAMRVVKTMPKWNPGKQNGKAVKVFYSMPVSFVASKK